MSLRLAVFASGGGSNLQALLDRFNQSKDSLVRVALVLSDRADAGALARARAARVDSALINAAKPSDYAAREMLAALEGADVDLIALAGYLKLVPPAVVRRYRGRLLNIHPALLPSFGGKGMYGLRVHQAVLASGCTLSGATVHHVDEKYDEGHIVAQWPVPVLTGDTPELLAARVLTVEHMLYPAAVQLVAQSLSADEALAAGMRPPATAFVTVQQTAPDEAALRRALGID